MTDNKPTENQTDTPIYDGVWNGQPFTGEPEGFTPDIPERARTIAYFFTLFGGALTGLIAGIIAIWFPQYSEQVNATLIPVNTFLMLIGGGFGVAYRPTR